MILSQEKQDELMDKRKKFQDVKARLKQEFFGMNKIIDEIMDMIESWYLFAEYQTRPLVVNLWGMTGTGKTSLVRRLAQLLKMEDSFIHTDMGEQVEGFNWRERSKFEESITRKDKRQSIICLDEFQLCRTKIDDHEIDRGSIRMFWELLDTGFIKTYDFYSSNYDTLKPLLNVLNSCLRKNVRVENGRIVAGKEIYLQLMKYAEDYNTLWDMNVDYDEPDLTDDIYFIPKNYRSELFEVFSDVFEDSIEFENYLLRLDGEETINLLRDAVMRSQNNKKYDLRKSLIFVVGNLDEVFQMSGEVNPDIDPDVFWKHSLNINLTQIKEGLAKRFRTEQIARLGNNHVIYPALSRSAYEELIVSELNKISMRFKQQTFTDLIFDKSINELIYREGVFPYQGARPVLTSVVRLIDAYLGKIIAQALSYYPGTDKFYWSFKDDRHHIDFIENNRTIYTMQIELDLKLESYRKTKNNNKQALVAVHESGHAIATALSSRLLPEKIVSVSPMGESGGFCHIEWPEEIISKKNIRHRIMSALGGYLAEKLMFGEENISRGSGMDLAYASYMANEAIKQQGMGSSVKTVNSNEFDKEAGSITNTKLELEAEKLILSCKDETEEMLKRNRELLVEMAKYLTVNSKMEKATIEDFMLKYAKDDWVRTDGFITVGEYYDYRDILFNDKNNAS